MQERKRGPRGLYKILPFSIKKSPKHINQIGREKEAEKGKRQRGYKNKQQKEKKKKDERSTKSQAQLN